MLKNILLHILLSLALTSSVCAQDKIAYGKIKQFIPEGYQILDSDAGDLNRDAYQDCIVILKSNDEDSNGDAARPMLLLTGSPDGKYRLFSRNDSVVLCKACGGAMGDPYQAIVIRRGYFSIEHYGGSSWRWTRIITFRYDFKSKAFLLHRDAGVSFHASDPDKQEKLVYNKSDFGRLGFTSFSNTKGQ